MKILMFTWKSFGDIDIVKAFEDLGHTVVFEAFDRENGDNRINKEKQEQLETAIRRETPDAVFTFNYFPIIALACKETDTRYLAWVYDAPAVQLYSYTIVFETNYVFVFDSDTYLEFASQGIKTVYYLPMAADPERLSAMQNWNAFEKTHWNNLGEVAFIGSLYTEKHNFYERMEHISPYTRGYLEGLMAAQRQVYGANFVENNLTEDILEDMKQDLPMSASPDGVERVSWLFAQYVINRKITSLERIDFLGMIGQKYALDLYTPVKEYLFEWVNNANPLNYKGGPGIINHGPVDYYDMAPYVFKKAKVNLNISLRSIVNGIPLRGFDILGAGGFLLTNYQGDFLQFFTPGEDFEIFESGKDMMDKLEYYLNPSNEAERAAIAANGLRKIMEAHTYRHRVEEMIGELRG